MAGLVEFLGLADRVWPLGISHPEAAVSIERLVQTLVVPVLPFDFRNHVVVLRLSLPLPSPVQLRFVTSAGLEVFGVALTLESQGELGGTTRLVFGAALRDATEDARPPIIWEPDVLSVHCRIGDETEIIGTLRVRFRRPHQLTDADRAALVSRLGPRIVRMTIGCSVCGRSMRVCTALDRATAQSTPETADALWHEDLPDYFECACDGPQGRRPLRYLREGMHALLFVPLLPDGTSSVKPPITLDGAETTLRTFRSLLDSAPREEEVQSFLENNPLLLAQFGARRLYVKPPILSRHKADFGVLTAQNELLLIEIERPAIALFRADGAPTAELTHAFSQPQAWNHEVVGNRDAVIRCIDPDLDPREVTAFSYLVIAGRSRSQDQENLVRLMRDPRAIRLITYDHLLDHASRAVHSILGS